MGLYGFAQEKGVLGVCETIKNILRRLFVGSYFVCSLLFVYCVKKKKSVL